MQVETRYVFGTKFVKKSETEPRRSFYVNDSRVPGGHIFIDYQPPTNLVIDVHRFDLTQVKLEPRAYEGEVTLVDGKIIAIIIQDWTKVDNAYVSLLPIHPGLRHYRRVRDKAQREWLLLEGEYPPEDTISLEGKILAQSYATGWLAGRCPPSIYLVGEGRKWRLLGSNDSSLPDTKRQ